MKPKPKWPSALYYQLTSSSSESYIAEQQYTYSQLMLKTFRFGLWLAYKVSGGKKIFYLAAMITARYAIVDHSAPPYEM